MPEMREALRVIGGFQGTIWPTQYPSGRYGFVGQVPGNLAYTMIDGSPVPDELGLQIRRHGAGLFRQQIKAVTFATLAEAIAAAVALGYQPTEDVQRLGLRKV